LESQISGPQRLQAGLQFGDLDLVLQFRDLLLAPDILRPCLGLANL
jgi:hypothetical protein